MSPRAARAVAVAIAITAHGPMAHADVVGTRHDLSAAATTTTGSHTGRGTCTVCHPPHSAAPQLQRWDPSAMFLVYQPYASATLQSSPGQPTGSSKMCLSCHDGTIALDMNTAPLARAGRARVRGDLDTDLSDDHPVSFVYDAALAARNGQLRDPAGLAGEGIWLDSTNQMQCTSCHDPHEARNRRFLVLPTAFSELCVKCHNEAGWAGSAHEASPAPLPHALRDRTAATASTVAEAGCGGCHVTHTAGSHALLLREELEEANCLVCHDGASARFDIGAELAKRSAHPVNRFFDKHSPGEDPALMPRHVECEDCHQPHAATGERAKAPFVGGALAQVPGVALQGSPVTVARYEYEVCLRCHARDNDVTIDRLIVQPNMRLQIDSWNPSYHPIAEVGKNNDVPSLLPPMTTQSLIYCTDCHNSDRGGEAGAPRGPHGSVWPTLLAREYETTDGGIESYQRYELCYGCHERTSILSDQSFAMHREHIVDERTSCATCHAPHGVPGTSDNNTHLINFSAVEVSPTPDGRMAFEDRGRYRGACTLTCHGHQHDDAAYPAIDPRWRPIFPRRDVQR